MYFATIIRNERKKQKLSMYRLAILSGVTRKTIMDVENGADIKLSTAEKLCKALGVSFVINW